MLNLEIRQFRNELVAMINERQLPIEVKSLIINDVARDVAAQADRTVVYEQLAQQEQIEKEKKCEQGKEPEQDKEATENVD